MVLTVSVVVACPPAAGVTAAAVQVGAGVTAGVMSQAKVTLELKLPIDLTVSVEVAEPPGVTEAGESEVPDTVKPGARLKIAVTVSLRTRLCWQVPVPEQTPLQPANTDPAPAVAVRVTGSWLLVNPALHVPGQLMPAGLLVTLPVPDPANTTVKVGVAGGRKVAVTNWLEFSVGAHAPVPVQGEFSPPQPPKIEPVPGVGVGVSVTCMPVVKRGEKCRLPDK